jgi:hypothetical protein
MCGQKKKVAHNYAELWVIFDIQIWSGIRKMSRIFLCFSSVNIRINNQKEEKRKKEKGCGISLGKNLIRKIKNVN